MMKKFKIFLSTLIIFWITIGVLVFEEIGWVYLALIFIFPFFGVDKLLVSDSYKFNRMKQLNEVEELIDSEESEDTEDFDGGIESMAKKYLKEDLEGYIEIAKHENNSELLNKSYEYTSIIQQSDNSKLTKK